MIEGRRGEGWFCCREVVTYNLGGDMLDAYARKEVDMVYTNYFADS
jgi:hypothetical protein